MDSKNNTLCRGCLNSGRKMHVVDEYWKKQCFLQIISEIPVFKTETDPVTLCWECDAKLRNFTNFKQQVKKSYKTLINYLKQNTCYTVIHTKPRLTEHSIINLSILSTKENVKSLQKNTMNVKSHLKTTNNVKSLLKTTENVKSLLKTTENVKSLLKTTENVKSLLKTTDNVETPFQVNILNDNVDITAEIYSDDDIGAEIKSDDETLTTTPNNNISDGYDDTIVDEYSDDEKIIMRRKKGNKVKNNKSKNSEDQLCGEDELLLNDKSEKCGQCLANFNNIEQLKNHVCIKQEKNQEIDILNGIIKEMTKSNEIELFKEVQLSRAEMEEERRMAILKEDYVNAMFKCERCIVSFANAEDMKDHIRLKHELNSSKFNCVICECSFASEVSYNYHTSKHARRYECGACLTRSTSKRAAAKHYEEYHCHGTVLEYNINSDNGRNEENPDIRSKQSGSSFPCEFCDKSFRWKASLRKHVETHRIETGQKRKPYCEPCRLSFTTTSNLQKHVKTSSKHQIQLKLRKLKESPPEDATSPEKEEARIDQIKCSVYSARQVFQCPQCDKKFQWRGNMLRHLNSHAARAKGELVCEPCNRTFSSIATYKQHMKISKKHVSENDFKYMCSDCGKRFANKTRLKDHINWEHLKNYVHTCSVCQKIFKSHTSLYLHKQVVHKKDNAEHLCHHCGKPFPNRAKLVGHMRAAHSGGAGYACDACGARFSWLSCLSRHARRAHKHNN